jgi:nucleotide-binding universal stress UspA family protein
MKAIIAAIDFSRSTDLIVAEAAGLARAYEGKVVLVTVLVEPVFVRAYALPPKKLQSITVSHERAVRHRLAEIQRQLQSEFVPAEIVLRRGDAAFHIVDAAEEHDAAFIAIGSHGHTALFELVLGSTTQRVMRMTKRPVIVSPSRARKQRRPHLRVLSMPLAD